MNKTNSKRFIIAALFCVFLLSFENLSAQDSTYYPKGNPKKWNFEVTPFFWIPWVSGQVTSTYLSENFDVPAIDLLTNLKMGFMINAELSKGMFFISPTYIYNRVGSGQVLRTDKKGEEALVSDRELTLNVAELLAGMRIPVSRKFLIDPFVGVRYDNFKTSIEANGKFDTITRVETTDFWDPVIGIRVNYFPHPRVPLSLRTDIGGFGAGSRISWTAALQGGYTVSRVIDLIAGFNVYGFNYQTKTTRDRTVGLTTVFYGFDLGIKIHLPGRAKDPAVFKKFKKD